MFFFFIHYSYIYRRGSRRREVLFPIIIYVITAINCSSLISACFFHCLKITQKQSEACHVTATLPHGGKLKSKSFTSKSCH